MARAPWDVVYDQLIASGYRPLCGLTLDVQDECIYFRPGDVLELVTALRRDTLNFQEGPFHGCHADLGPNRVDFRSHTGTYGRGSLQFCIGQTTGQGYLDVDRFSPYSDLFGVFGHLGEMVASRWRSFWSRLT